MRHHPERHRSLRSRLLLGAMVTAVATTTACSGSGGGSADPTDDPSTSRPMPPRDVNVIVVVTDDSDDPSCKDFASYMPKTAALLQERGTCFDNATATAPTCAPSRAALMTSQMGHNSGAPRQEDALKVRVEDTIQHTLSEAGYDTYGTGKYFNGIQAFDVESGAIDSGFGSSDFWSSSKPYGYELWDDATGAPYLPEDQVHATTRAGDFLRSFIEREQDSDRPFYGYVAFKAPHTDNSAPTPDERLPLATPANRDRAVPPFRWDPETDTRDKLPVFQKRIGTRAYYDKLYTARTRAQYDVDDEMGKTFDVLRETGQLDNTAIFFTSDQGYHLGENGWETKGDPYPATSNVPLLAWLPGSFEEGYTEKRPYGLIDIGPTIYDITGVEPDHVVDGRTMLSSFRRTGTYSEVVNESAKIDYKLRGFSPGRVPSWSMYRRGQRAYIEYYDPQGRLIRAEYYADPGMKRNLLWRGYRSERPSAATLAFFRDKLRAGRTCAGTFEQRTPNPCP